MSQTPQDKPDNVPRPSPLAPAERPASTPSSTATGANVPGPLLPAPLPALVAGVGEARLRWLCLRLAEALQAGPLAGVWALEVDEFSDLAAELAELLLGGLAGRRRRAAVAWARLSGRHGPLQLDEGQRQAWIAAWAAQLRRAGLPAHQRRPLERWMGELTAPWVVSVPGGRVLALRHPG